LRFVPRCAANGSPVWLEPVVLRERPVQFPQLGCPKEARLQTAAAAVGVVAAAECHPLPGVGSWMVDVDAMRPPLELEVRPSTVLELISGQDPRAFSIRLWLFSFFGLDRRLSPLNSSRSYSLMMNTAASFLGRMYVGTARLYRVRMDRRPFVRSSVRRWCPKKKADE
jgi:hypothetical protein